MLADTNFFDVIQRGPQSLGAVNGETISLDEYNSRVQYYTDQHNRQSNEPLTPEVRAKYEQQAWNDLVDSKLMQQKMDDLGIHVTDQEVVDMITGENPDPFIRQQFGNEDGTIDRAALQTAIESPENRQLWITVEQQMRQKRRQQKMNNFLQSSMEVSSYEIEQHYIRNNTTADISFVRFPYADVDESEITVSESDLRDYYNNNQDDFEREESYQIEYVGFDTSPTSEDTTRTFEELEQLRPDFAEAAEDSSFFNQYQSDTPYEVNRVDKDNIRELYEPVLDVGENEVTEVIQDQGRLYLLKKLEETADEVEFVTFSRDIRADPIATIDARAETADDFSFYAQEDGFESEAERRDLEIQEAFATKGNDFISGIGQSRQIMSFLENASEGEISEPIELSGQIVVVKASEITPEGVEPFEEVKEQIRTTVTNNKRKQQMLDRANKLASENESLQGLAEAAGKEVQVANSLAMNAASIPEAGREPKVIGAIFGLDEGEQSNAIEGTSAAFIVRVDQMQEPDLENLTASAQQKIRQQLQEQKSSDRKSVV